jgi:uncharacterized protein with HEPN domain
VREDRARLHGILEAIEHIEPYAVRGRAAFEQDELVQTWIVHHLLILGEAASGLSPGFRTGLSSPACGGPRRSSVLPSALG